MDIREVLAQAKRNQQEASKRAEPRYSTNVLPPKKLPHSKVDPKAIKALLRRQREDKDKKDLEAKKKKEELLKRRDESKNTKKANSMAKRTKDNLKVYNGEDVLGLHSDPKKRRRRGPPSPVLTPEEDRQHKAFMKSITKLKVPGLNGDSNDGYKEPMMEQDERKMRKMEKYKAKARSASNLEFNDLLRLAEERKDQNTSESSSSDDDDSGEDSDGLTDKYGRPLTAEEKYQRERRKRRELEEKLKNASTNKKNSNAYGDGDPQRKVSNSLSNFKIGKLDRGMSEESKRAKVKALMEKFNRSSTNGAKVDSTKNNAKRNEHKSSSNSHSTTRISKSSKSFNEKEKRGLKRSQPDHIRNDSSSAAKVAKRSNENVTTDQISSYLKQQQHLSSSAQKKEKTKAPQTSSKNHVVKSKGESRPMKKNNSTLDISHDVIKKQVNSSNPYKHTVVKAKPPPPKLVDPWVKKKQVKEKKLPPPLPGQCTLSITSESVRTNYPGVAREDPYIQAYKKTGRVLQNFTPEMIDRYKQAMVRKLRDQGRPIPSALRGNVAPPQQRRRPGVIVDDSEDEYDSELDDFIADDDEEVEDEDIDVSMHIKSIFGYDKSKYGRESEYELSKMDASYKDIEREEKRSLRIAKEEDAKEAKLEEERLKKKMKRRH